MRIKLSSIVVDDQEKALAFYTGVLGFIKKQDIPMGPYRWLTVVSPESRDDLELVLEPNANPAAKVYQEALFAQGVPVNAFEVSDLQAEFESLKAAGVVFRREPAPMGPVNIAAFEDTCGNVIQLYQITAR